MADPVVQTLPVEDVSRMIRVLGEVAAMSHPLEARRTALMERVLELVDGDSWLWAHARFDPAEQDPVWFTLLEGGWRDDAERALAMESINHPSVLREVFARVDKSKHVSFARQQVSPPKVWDADDYRRKFSDQTGVEDTVLSLYPVSERVTSAVGVNRRRGKPHFSPREIAILHIMLGQIDWLHRVPAEVPANDDGLLSVPRRQREVLMHLLCGASVKEIAARMTISPHTVSDYTKALYRRFEVNGRVELLRKFMSGVAAQPGGPAALANPASASGVASPPPVDE